MPRHARREQFYINQLIDQIEGDYVRFRYHVKYGRRRDIGEIDVLALRRDGQWDIYEVKSSKKGIGKAKQQLRRAKAKYTHDNLAKAFIIAIIIVFIHISPYKSTHFLIGASTSYHH